MFCFVFNNTATTEIYTYGPSLSLHDALPISKVKALVGGVDDDRVPIEAAFLQIVEHRADAVVDRRDRSQILPHVTLIFPQRELAAREICGIHAVVVGLNQRVPLDRKSTRLKSSH